MPSTTAVVSDSTSPPNTSTSVSRDRTTYASTCSSGRAAPATRRAMSRRSVTRLRGGATDGHLAHEHGGLAGRHGHALAVLAAHAGPRVEVVADRVDPAEHVGTVADELRGPHRPRDLAVLDEVRLGDAEHEVASGGIHLSTAELHAVEAVL